MSVIAQAGAKGRQLHKFGGSSLADAKCYLRVAGIMKEYSQAGDMMVVSAAGSTTNQLISWLKQPERSPCCASGSAVASPLSHRADWRSAGACGGGYVDSRLYPRP